MFLAGLATIVEIFPILARLPVLLIRVFHPLAVRRSGRINMAEHGSFPLICVHGLSLPEEYSSWSGIRESDIIYILGGSMIVESDL